MTQFKTKNELWKQRTTHGKDKIFGDPELLMQEALRYFDWCDRTPWMRAELVKYKGDAEHYDTPLGRPYTMDGLTVVLGVSGAYFRAAKANIRDREEKGVATPNDLAILETILTIETIVRNQQIEGAAVGVFNSNLISRMNNIADNINNVNTGETTLKVTVRDQQTADDLNELDALL